MSHQDLTPSNIILSLIPPEPTSDDPEPQVASDLHMKFRVKLGEYLNIKMLSDIAFQKTNLFMTQARMAQERAAGQAQPNLDYKGIIASLAQSK